MARLSLPPNPDACLPLGEEDFARLKDLHGASLWTVPFKGCPTCGDKRWFARRKHGGGDVDLYDCDCEQQWLLYLWLLNAGIGTSYQRLCLDDVPDDRLKSVMEALDYMADDRIQGNLRLGLGLMLWSESRGTGKTLVSTLVLKKVLAAGYDGFFTTFSDMLDMYQSTWRDPEQKRWFDRKVRNVSFLVIDDIGKEGQTRSRSVTESMVDSVIRARNSAALPTIITTNFTPDQIDQGYSVASLLAGTVKPIEIVGADFRQVQREQAEQDVLDDVYRPVVMV